MEEDGLGPKMLRGHCVRVEPTACPAGFCWLAHCPQETFLVMAAAFLLLEADLRLQGSCRLQPQYCRTPCSLNGGYDSLCDSLVRPSAMPLFALRSVGMASTIAEQVSSVPMGSLAMSFSRISFLAFQASAKLLQH